MTRTVFAPAGAAISDGQEPSEATLQRALEAMQERRRFRIGAPG